LLYITVLNAPFQERLDSPVLVEMHIGRPCAAGTFLIEIPPETFHRDLVQASELIVIKLEIEFQRVPVPFNSTGPEVSLPERALTELLMEI
jgi:hypothetical protein